MKWFDIAAGVTTFIAFVLAGYSYYRQVKAEHRQKQVEDVAKGFHSAIRRQVIDLGNQLVVAKGIVNNDYFEVLHARVESALSSAHTLRDNVDAYRSTLWPESEEKSTQ